MRHSERSTGGQRQRHVRRCPDLRGKRSAAAERVGQAICGEINRLVEPDDYNGGHAIFAAPTMSDRNLDAPTISTERPPSVALRNNAMQAPECRRQPEQTPQCKAPLYGRCVGVA